MGRIKDSTLSQTIAATTLATCRHDKALAMDAVSRIHVLNTGTNNSIAGSGVDNYKVKHATSEKWSIAPTELRALLDALLGPLGGSLPATSALAYTIPLDLFLPLPIGLKSDVVPGLKAFEIYLNAANSSAGASLATCELCDVEPQYMSVVVSGTTGVGASVTKGAPYFITSPNPDTDLFVGFILPLGSSSAYITRVQILRKLANGGYDELFDGTRQDVLQSQAHYNPEAVTASFFFKLPGAPITMPPGSKIVLTTGASALASDIIVPVYLEKW